MFIVMTNNTALKLRQDKQVGIAAKLCYSPLTMFLG